MKIEMEAKKRKRFSGNHKHVDNYFFPADIGETARKCRACDAVIADHGITNFMTHITASHRDYEALNERVESGTGKCVGPAR